jgi:hypothetical protein
MSGTRPSLFEEDTELDLSRFAPKTELERPPVPPETVRQISEEGGFPSRAPELRRTASPPGPVEPPSRGRTGRTFLLNARLTQRAHDRFHEILAAEQRRYDAGEIFHRVTLGELVERALAALEREMVGKL